MAPSLLKKEVAMASGPGFRTHPTAVLLLWATMRTLVSRLRTTLAAHHENSVARQAFMNMTRLDDKMLDDIGVTRDEVAWAASLPLRVDASHALYARARRRRAGHVS
jgi:uncharacterized protein YjiS (DUF1127 family)